MAKNRKKKTAQPTPAVTKPTSQQEQVTARQPLSSAWKLLRRSLGVLVRNRKVFLGIAGIYALLSLVLVYGFNLGTGDLASIKGELNEDGGNKISTGLLLFSYMIGAMGSFEGPASAYIFILSLITSLALIWTLRQVYAGKTVRIRDGFYRGMYPMVPFIIVLVVIFVQLIPLVIAAWIYTVAITTGVIAGGLERIIWQVFLALAVLWSLYMTSASVFGLYIVSLPDMTPLKAIRSARELVKGRRWTVMRKLVIFGLLVSVFATIIMVATLLSTTLLAGAMFFMLSVAGLAVFHGFMYALYRELVG